MIESKTGCVVLRQADQLMRQPGDGVRLAAAGRVLDQIAPARAVRLRVGQELAHHVELMEARPDLHRFFLPVFSFFFSTTWA